MEFTDFTATKDDAGKRFDKVVRKMLAESYLSSLYKNIRTGFIKLNGKNAKAETRLCECDKISVASFLLDNKVLNADYCNEKRLSNNDEFHSLATFPLPIIFETDDIIIINKPYDMTVQKTTSTSLATHSEKLSVAEIIKMFFQTDSLSFIPAPLHRLDRQTTGLLVCSKSLLGARWFSEIIGHRKLQKKYLAVVEGILDKSEKWIDTIEIDSKSQTANSFAFHTVKLENNKTCKNNFLKESKSLTAITNVTPIASGEFSGKTFTLAKFDIETGRKHQIRTQAACHGHALLGDTAYGAKKILPALYESCGKQQLFLHAYEIYFPENELGLPQKIVCPLPENFQKLLAKIFPNVKTNVKIMP